MNIIVFDDSEWGKGLALADERALHIRDVLKPELGQTLRVALLDQGAGLAVYRGVAHGQLHLDFPEPRSLEKNSAPLPLTVILGQPRPPVMQRLLKDLNATGVARIFVVGSDLSEKSYMNSRLWQLDEVGTMACRRFLVQGAQQGGQSFLSQVWRFYSLNRSVDACDLGLGLLVANKPGLAETNAMVPTKPGNALVWEKPQQPEAEISQPAISNSDIPSLRFMLDLDESADSLLKVASQLAESLIAGQSLPIGGVIVAIGPERGWSQRERLLLKQRGFQTISVGKSILRTETACNLACGMLAMAIDNG